MPGLAHRFGPAHGTGDARLPHTGSVSTLRPPTCTRNVECPTHVAVSASGAARGVANAGVAYSASVLAGGSGRRGDARRPAIHRATPPSPCGEPAGHGLRKPPPGVWCGARSFGGGIMSLGRGVAEEATPGAA